MSRKKMIQLLVNLWAQEFYCCDCRTPICRRLSIYRRLNSKLTWVCQCATPPKIAIEKLMMRHGISPFQVGIKASYHSGNPHVLHPDHHIFGPPDDLHVQTWILKRGPRQVRTASLWDVTRVTNAPRWMKPSWLERSPDSDAYCDFFGETVGWVGNHPIVIHFDFGGMG